MRTILLLAIIAGAVGTAKAQEEGRKFALIIGNDNYPVSPLKNAVRDAREMDRALQAAGFKTVVKENARKSDMDRAVGEFLDKIGPDDTVLFYYAGHGVQIENENFLVPVDFEPGDSLSSAKFSCFSLAQIYDELARSEPSAESSSSTRAGATPYRTSIRWRRDWRARRGTT